MTTDDHPARAVALVSLGCARNDVDGEELAAHLNEHGWRLVEDPAEADVALVNTCGFIQEAKKDSIDAVLEAADLKESGATQAVVAVGCLAQRYGRELAEALPEADAVLGFDAYPELSDHLHAVLAGRPIPSHEPGDRRKLLPLAPAQRHQRPANLSIPGHGHDGHRHTHEHPASPPEHPRATEPMEPTLGGPQHRILRRRLSNAPWAPLKIASGCDRRCTFCAIPTFRGAFVSRPPQDIVAEARWLAGQGVREVLLVSENSTSYGKDLGDLKALESLLVDLAEVDGLDRIRVSYLQPAELRPALVEVMCTTPRVAPYFDLSFQHASPEVLTRMRRFGSSDTFLGLIAGIRELAPQAGIRSNVIVGFPGECEADLEELEGFLVAARLDAIGVFGYSPEEGTAAYSHEGQLDPDLIAERRERVSALAEELTARRAQERLGERVQVLVEEHEPVADPDLVGGDELSGLRVLGRAVFQGPDTEGSCELLGFDAASAPAVGSIVTGTVVATDGVDLLVEAT